MSRSAAESAYRHGKGRVPAFIHPTMANTRSDDDPTSTSFAGELPAVDVGARTRQMR